MPDPLPPSFNHIKEFKQKNDCFQYWMEVKSDSGTNRIQCWISRLALEDKAMDFKVVLTDLEAALPYIEKYWGEITQRCQMKHMGNKHEPDGTILIRTGDI